jgi:CDP-4-dehydro-6-deoxyglucose reductase
MAEPPKFARVTAITPLTPSVRNLHFKMVEPAVFEYRAGQTLVLYAGFREGKEIKRQYTLASAPHEQGGREFDLCVKIIPEGPASAYLETLKPGDQIRFSGPVGRCVLPESHDGDFLFCATGNGIAPLRGMLLSYFHEPPKHEASGGLLSRIFKSGPKLRLLWGVRHEDDFFWIKELLEPLAAAHKAFRYELFVSRSSPEYRGARGRLNESALSLARELTHPKVFLIGNGAMIKELRGRLETEAKLSRDDIVFEAFFNPRTGSK